MHEQKYFWKCETYSLHRPLKRPTQIASHAGVSIGAHGVATLLQDVTDP